MPRKNGFETSKAIRLLPDPMKSHIPIVAMTANAFEEDRRASIKAGMNAHIAKPIDLPLLYNTLAQLLK